MHTRSPWLTFFILLSGIFITLEASSFISPALPYISSHFGISTSNASIITVAYYITAISLAPLLGRLGDQKGRKKIVVIGLLLFSVSEFMAAFSPNIYIFLFARLVQGIGYACIFSNVFAYIPELFEENKRGKAIGFFMLFTYIATGTGGVISGLLIKNFGWNAIFICSGSLALVGFVLVSLLVPVPTVPSNNKAPVDFLGGTLFMLTITAIISLPLVISNFGLTSMATIGLFLSAIVFLIVLVMVERKVLAPVIDFSVLKVRGISISAVLITFQNITMMSIVYSLTFYASAKAGWSAVEVGLITTVNFSVAALISPIVGQLLDRFRPLFLVFIALIASLIGAVIFTTVSVDSTLIHLLIVMFFIGICSGCLNASLMKIIINETPENKKGVGTGTFGLFKDLGIPLGSTFGLSLFGSAQASKLDDNISNLAMDAGVDSTLAGEVVKANKTGVVSEQLQQAFTELGIQFNELIAQAKAISTSSAIQTVGFVNITILAVLLLLSFALIQKKMKKA